MSFPLTSFFQSWSLPICASFRSEGLAGETTLGHHWSSTTVSLPLVSASCVANPPTGPAARPACAPTLQVFRCVGAWMCAHTPGKRVSLVRTAAAPPFCLPSLLLVLPLNFGQLAKKLPPTVRPHKLRPCFQVPTERRSFTHSRSHDRSLKVRFFRSQLESSRTIHVGGRTDTTNRLSENHL